MNPDVAQAIPEFVHSGILEREKEPRIMRIARGELLSVHAEIRLLFYLGVLLTTAGAGVLIEENYQHIGPVAVAVLFACSAAALFVWAARKAPDFSWAETPSPSMGYEYLLLLSVLLGAADLAFIEVQFTPLGAHWLWHLLIVSLLMAGIAIRYDSRTIFSLALSTFAAWRGLSVSLMEKPIWRISDDSLRLNALGCGLMFVFLGRFLLHTRRKPHFEPTAVYLGWLLALGALVSGGTTHGTNGVVYVLLLLGTGCGVAWRYFRLRRFLLFVFGVLAVFIGLNEMVLKSDADFMIQSLAVSIMAIGMVALLWKTHRKMKEPL
jgi:hypothetical protein